MRSQRFAIGDRVSWVHRPDWIEPADPSVIVGVVTDRGWVGPEPDYAVTFDVNLVLSTEIPQLTCWIPERDLAPAP